MSYATILEGAGAVANALVEQGLQSGERVAIVSDGPEFYYAFFGISMAGGVPAALYPPARLICGERMESSHGGDDGRSQLCGRSHRAPLTSPLGRTGSHS